MNELISINYDNPERPVVSGRELYKALKIETRYNDWFSRMCEYGFTENKDFYSILSKSTGGRPSINHAITIPMAKELCMIQRTEIGRQFRQYFIAVEEAWNSPEMIMQRALSIANEHVKALQVSVSHLTVENQIMQPKAEYFDALVDRNLLTRIRDTAKELHIKQNDFVRFLLNRKYLYRSKKGKLLPYAQYVDNGLFELKEFTNDKTGFSNTQTMITPKGKETFRLLFI